MTATVEDEEHKASVNGVEEDVCDCSAYGDGRLVRARLGARRSIRLCVCKGGGK